VRDGKKFFLAILVSIWKLARLVRIQGSNTNCNGLS